MIAADHDRRTDLSGPHERVEGKAGLGALPVAEPADARGQALEWDPLLRHGDPSPEAGVIGEQLENGTVGPCDVGWVARQRDPPERPATFAELRPDEGGHEPRIVEGVRDACLLRL